MSPTIHSEKIGWNQLLQDCLLFRTPCFPSQVAKVILRHSSVGKLECFVRVLLLIDFVKVDSEIGLSIWDQSYLKNLLKTMGHKAKPLFVRCYLCALDSWFLSRWCRLVFLQNSVVSFISFWQILGQLCTISNVLFSSLFILMPKWSQNGDMFFQTSTQRPQSIPVAMRPGRMLGIISLCNRLEPQRAQSKNCLQDSLLQALFFHFQGLRIQ